MKTAEDWTHIMNVRDYTVTNLIKLIQIDAWNEAIEAAAENADIEVKKKCHYGKYRKWQKVKEDDVDLFSYAIKYGVNKESILKLKK